jgi:organic hydroperoxide reductase OsmC/OhrA
LFSFVENLPINEAVFFRFLTDVNVRPGLLEFSTDMGAVTWHFSLWKFCMNQHSSVITWERAGAIFSDGRYGRAHAWTFDGGQAVHASASPHVVPPPMSDPRGIDPEEAFVASLSSCHMLWFLSIAAKRGFIVDRYRDEASGVLEKNAAGRMGITVVTLRPRAQFSGTQVPTDEQIRSMHEAAHAECFIANSVTTDVRCEPAAWGSIGNQVGKGENTTTPH